VKINGCDLNPGNPVLCRMIFLREAQDGVVILGLPGDPDFDLEYGVPVKAIVLPAPLPQRCESSRETFPQETMQEAAE
jgi:hypothetical protein